MTLFHLRDRLKGILGRGAKDVPAAATPVVPAPPVAAETAPRSTAPAPRPSAPTPTAAPPSPAPSAANTQEPASDADEEKQRRHWARTRKGMLGWLVEQGGSASMAAMHERSEKKFFVAHRAFSRLMEEFTEEALVEYTATTGLVVLTEAGRAAHAELLA